ncbi:MAG: DUF2147 domain-containing protein [Rhodobacteraceae bacterium]|nr:DUF2147 domain-containing protein [Paracoccaceae bacterium]
MAAHADPVHGVWKTQPGDDGAYGHVEMSDCGGKTCGVLIAGFDASGTQADSPNIGKRMVWDMQARSNGTYAGGKIWAPDRDKTYNSRMELSGNSLKVEGCVLVVCRGQTWTRVQ